MNYYYICCYTVDWTDEKKGMEIDYLNLPWYHVEYKRFAPYAPLVNIEFLDKYPKNFKRWHDIRINEMHVNLLN